MTYLSGLSKSLNESKWLQTLSLLQLGTSIYESCVPGLFFSSYNQKEIPNLFNLSTEAACLRKSKYKTRTCSLICQSVTSQDKATLVKVKLAHKVSVTTERTKYCSLLLFGLHNLTLKTSH